MSIHKEAFIEALRRDTNRLLFQAFTIQHLYINDIPKELVDEVAQYIIDKALEYYHGPEDSDSEST